MTGINVSRAATLIGGPPVVMVAATETAIRTETVPFLEIVIANISMFGQSGDLTIQHALIITSTFSGLVAVLFSIVKFFLKQD